MNIIMIEYTRRFFKTIETGTISDLMPFLNSAVEIDTKNEDGIPALNFAISHKKYTCIPLMLRHGANPNVYDKIGDTPLHVALKAYTWATDKTSKKAAVEAIQVLLKHKADPYQTNDKGHSAAYIARINKATDIINLMVDLS